jgi:hypothetical protein
LKVAVRPSVESDARVAAVPTGDANVTADPAGGGGGGGGGGDGGGGDGGGGDGDGGVGDGGVGDGGDGDGGGGDGGDGDGGGGSVGDGGGDAGGEGGGGGCVAGVGVAAGGVAAGGGEGCGVATTDVDDVADVSPPPQPATIATPSISAAIPASRSFRSSPTVSLFIPTRCCPTSSGESRCQAQSS